MRSRVSSPVLDANITKDMNDVCNKGFMLQIEKPLIDVRLRLLVGLQ